MIFTVVVVAFFMWGLLLRWCGYHINFFFFFSKKSRSHKQSKKKKGKKRDEERSCEHASAMRVVCVWVLFFFSAVSLQHTATFHLRTTLKKSDWLSLPGLHFVVWAPELFYASYLSWPAMMCSQFRVHLRRSHWLFSTMKGEAYRSCSLLLSLLVFYIALLLAFLSLFFFFLTLSQYT